MPKAGQLLRFKGYKDDVAEADRLFKPGDTLVVIEDTYEDGTTLAGKAGDTSGVMSIVYPEEFEPVEDPEAKPVTAKKAAKAKKEKPKPVAEPVEQESRPAAEEERFLVSDSAKQAVVPQTESVRQILAESTDALRAAKILVERGEQTAFTLGGVLKHIYDNGLYKSLGYEGKRGFEDYLRNELGVEYRKAMYLMSIYDTFVKLGLDESKISEIGWSKAKELPRVAKLASEARLIEDFDRLVDYAKTHSRAELIDHIRTTYVDETPENAKVRVMHKTFSVRLSNQQAETVEAALELAKQRIGASYLDAALEAICVEWHSMVAGLRELTLEEEIERLSAKFGVRLAVVQDA